LQRRRTYFSELAGRAWLLVGLFGFAFYFLCLLGSRHDITTSEGGVLLGTYWAASTLYFSKVIYDAFPRFYKNILLRMRLYRPVRWFFQWHLGYSIMFLPFLYFVLMDYSVNVKNAFDNYTVRLLFGAYGVSLFSIVFVYTIISNIVGVSRGVRCSKQRRDA
jgi:hypothetical protein